MVLVVASCNQRALKPLAQQSSAKPSKPLGGWFKSSEPQQIPTRLAV